jgi:tRNA dimethylallyltransferase
MSADAVLIAGPTASGKSAVALALASQIGGVLINTDSMQVYREARILTARPGDEELRRVPHLLYGHVSVRESYSVARFQSDAIAALAEARAMRRVPIFVGGTGMYFGALTEGIADMPAVPAAIRASARERREALGQDGFFEALRARDPESAARLRASDTQRVLRAYEVVEATGRPIGEWQRAEAVPVLAGLKVARFVLSPPRAELHRRIDARFDAMLETGAMDEAAALAGLDPALPAAKILGLREIWAYQAGALSLEAAKTQAKAASRQYAKRQLTWFRNRTIDWNWIEAQDLSNIVAKMLPQTHDIA